MVKLPKETFSRWDTADHLHTEADMAGYLQACREEAPGDEALMAATVADVERARARIALAPGRGQTT